MSTTRSSTRYEGHRQKYPLDGIWDHVERTGCLDLVHTMSHAFCIAYVSSTSWVWMTYCGIMWNCAQPRRMMCYEVDHMYTPCMQISSASKLTWVAGTKHLIGHWGTDKYNSCALTVTTRKDSSFKHSWNGTSGKNTMGQSGGIT